MLRVVALLVLALLVSGCGAVTAEETSTRVDLAALVRILPTPPGLDQSSQVATVDAAALQKTFAGVAKPEAAKVYEEIGFAGGAMRTWSGPNGARVWAVVSRWPDHQTATNVGGGAVQRAAETAGLSAWTPTAISGARGARSDIVRVLSVAVADLSLVVRTDGPVPDTVIVRTMDLLTRPARAAQNAQ